MTGTQGNILHQFQDRHKEPVIFLQKLLKKLQLTGQNLGRVISSRSGHVHGKLIRCHEVKQPSLKLKTRPKQLLGSFQSLPHSSLHGWASCYT